MLLMLFMSFPVEYAQGEEPHLIKTGKFKTDGKKACIALSPDGNVIALACGSMLSLVNALTGDVDKEIHNIYSGNHYFVLSPWLVTYFQTCPASRRTVT